MLTVVKKQGVACHISSSSSQADINLLGAVKGKNKKRRGRRKKRWEDNIKEWTKMGFASMTMGC